MNDRLDFYQLMQSNLENRRIARNGSWVNDLFESFNLTGDEKHEVILKLKDKMKPKESKNE